MSFTILWGKIFSKFIFSWWQRNVLTCKYSVTFFHRLSKDFFYKITDPHWSRLFWTLWPSIPFLSWVSVCGIIVQSDKHTWKDISFFQSNVNLEQRCGVCKMLNVVPLFWCVCLNITLFRSFSLVSCVQVSFSTVNISVPLSAKMQDPANKTIQW